MLRKHATPGTFIALLALVFALTGGAFAATGGVGSGNGGGGGRGGSDDHASPGLVAISSKVKPKAKVGPRGPAGPAGKTGAGGPAGATGPAGASGPAGATGPGGPQGPAGTGAEGKEGKEGKEGPKGLEGKQGVIHPGETLPTGASETGTWGGNVNTTETYLPISFPIPLAKALGAAAVHVIGPGEGEKEEHENAAIIAGECSGTYVAPGAGSGNLCVFITPEFSGATELTIFNLNTNPVGSAGPGAATTGAELLINLTPTPAEGQLALGSWAVTG
jgi:hypothetical protein